MKLLIIDTETTGLKPSDGCIAIEVGAILYSVPFRTPLQSISFLIPTGTNAASHINGIDPLITQIEQPWESALSTFYKMAESADYALAHNADFDRQWFGMDRLPALDLKWICSLADFDWGDLPGRSLRDLALAHGIAVMPEVHRALPDCQLLSNILGKRDDLEELIKTALLPRLTYRAIVSFKDKDQAKSRGFRWNPDKKHWLKNLTSEEADLISREGLKLQVVAQ